MFFYPAYRATQTDIKPCFQKMGGWHNPKLSVQNTAKRVEGGPDERAAEFRGST